jgi:hypothetical protein
LYRGIEEEYDVSNPATSWTTDREMAEEFTGEGEGGQVLEKEVPREQIFMYYRGPYWKGDSVEGPDGEELGELAEEFVVLSDVPEQMK